MAADFLAGTVELVLEAGGWIHPEARFVVEGGDVRVTSTAPDGDRLIVLPSSCLIPVTRVQWSHDLDVLAMDGLLDELTDLELELLVLQMALLNRLERVPWLIRTHPLLAPMSDAAIAAVRTVAPDFRTTQWTPADVLWSNRVMWIARDGGNPEPFALPLIDLLNHRVGGAVGIWDGDAFLIDIAHGSRNECVMDYGHDRDAIQMATTYGFVDTSCAIARSAVSDAVYGAGSRPTEEIREADLALLEDLSGVLGGEPGPAAAVLHGAVAHQRRLIG